MPVKIIRSSGNVFKDIGFSDTEAAHLLVRSELMIQLHKIIESKGLKQVDAARLFHVSQPRVSALMKGRIDLFSIDTLIDMLACVGFKVKVALSKSSPRKVAPRKRRAHSSGVRHVDARRARVRFTRLLSRPKVS